MPIPDLAPVSLQLLDRRKPIFAEKTLCTSLEAAEDLAMHGGDRYIFAMHKWHYHPGIQALRQVADSGRIGDLQEIFTVRHGWVQDLHGGDAFWTLAVHDLTIIEHLCGSIPATILYSHVIRDALGVAISLSAALEQGVVAHISVNARHAHKTSQVSIHGERGSAVLGDAYDDHITVMDEAGRAEIGIDTTMPLYLELKEFVEHLQGGPRPRCDLRSAREVTRVLLDLRARAAPAPTAAAALSGTAV